jgi:bisanhydrobacterioruberin hydratase
MMKHKTAILILVAIYLVGLIGFLIPQTEAVFSGLTASTILVSFIFLMMFHKDWSMGFVAAFFLIAITGFLIEYIGVTTGLIFGSYVYGDHLGLKILDVPLLKGVNWFTLIYCSRAVLQKHLKHPLLLALFASIIMLLYDYFLEPFAIHRGLWTWATVTPPIHNFIGWFIMSLLIHLGYINSRKQVANPVALPLLVTQWVFFGVMGVVKGWIPYWPV